MSTWYDDLKKSNPALAADYAIVGAGQDRTSLRHMVKALSVMTFLNTAEDRTRFAAAKRILKATRNRAKR